MKNFSDYQTIFFDLDGTMADSAEGILNSLEYSLKKSDRAVPKREILRSYIGPSLSETYREVFGMKEQEINLAKDYYREFFEAEGYRQNKLYPGIKELLETLSAQGKTLAVATAKPTVHASQILEEFGVKKYFREVFGSNLDGSREQKHEVIEFALEQLADIDKSTIVMVGDRMHDIIGAKMNGLAVIAAGYGYGTAEEIAEAAPNASADTVAELAELLGCKF